MTISKSPERGNFQRDAYIKRCKEEGKEPRPELVEMYSKWQTQADEKETSDGWKKNNLEYDLRSSPYMLDKVCASDVYAQNLYATLCNNEFQKLDTWQILKNETWRCSWRYAGGIIADMVGHGDYIDWYCSGIRNAVSDQEYMDMTQEQKSHYDSVRDYVSEGTVTEEIKLDLKQLGWQVIDTNDE